mmetsp:Transcript_4770/g.15546  ORF Transcript_4770/g.15546 Transcript_4770/m.15546 type:complete len:296 (-) Transcript_4770:307-1194(-)
MCILLRLRGWAFRRAGALALSFRRGRTRQADDVLLNLSCVFRYGIPRCDNHIVQIGPDVWLRLRARQRVLYDFFGVVLVSFRAVVHFGQLRVVNGVAHGFLIHFLLVWQQSPGKSRREHRVHVLMYLGAFRRICIRHRHFFIFIVVKRLLGVVVVIDDWKRHDRHQIIREFRRRFILGFRRPTRFALLFHARHRLEPAQVAHGSRFRARKHARQINFRHRFFDGLLDFRRGIFGIFTFLNVYYRIIRVERRYIRRWRRVLDDDSRRRPYWRRLLWLLFLRLFLFAHESFHECVEI